LSMSCSFAFVFASRLPITIGGRCDD
jgi:hypothetical protein